MEEDQQGSEGYSVAGWKEGNADAWKGAHAEGELSPKDYTPYIIRLKNEREYLNKQLGEAKKDKARITAFLKRLEGGYEGHQPITDIVGERSKSKVQQKFAQDFGNAMLKEIYGEPDGGYTEEGKWNAAYPETSHERMVREAGEKYDREKAQEDDKRQYEEDVDEEDVGVDDVEGGISGKFEDPNQGDLPFSAKPGANNVTDLRGDKESETSLQINGNYWMDRSGRLYRVLDHHPGAIKILDKMGVAVDKTGEAPKEELLRRGFARLVASRKYNQVMAELGAKVGLTQYQRRALKEIGREHNAEVFEDGGGYIHRPVNTDKPDDVDENPFSAKPGAAKLMKEFKEFARGPGVLAPEAMVVDLDNPIPRFAENINRNLTRAMGFERIPLVGRLFGPRGRLRDDVDRATIGYAVKRQIGNSQAALIGARLNALKEDLGRPFKQDENGRITNVKADPKQSRFISDLFEDWQRQVEVPERMRKDTNIDERGVEHRVFSDTEIANYKEKNPANIELTPEQDKFFRALLEPLVDGYQYLGEKKLQLEAELGDAHTQKKLPGFHGDLEVYPFPRVALYKRSEGPLKAEFNRRVGGQYKIDREREYATEQEGQPDVAYEPDITKRIVTFIQRVYKAVADADLANDPALEGKTPEQRGPLLAKEYEGEMRRGEMSQHDINDMSYRPRLGREGVVQNQPGFEDKIYPREIAEKLNRAFAFQHNRIVNTAAELSKLSKALILTGDLAQYLQQGGPMMFRHPKAWGNAVAASIKSLGDAADAGGVSGHYLSKPENYQAATEFVQMGGSLGHLQDFMSGANPGELATKIPVAREVIRRSGKAFGTFFDISKIEMWKALRDSTPEAEKADMIEGIDNIVLSGKMEAAGVSHGQSVIERLLFMAPAYLRGSLQLVAGMVGKSAAAKEQQKTVATYVAGVMGAMTASYLAAGMSWEEIRKRLTPGADNGKFLTFPVPVGGGRTVEIGPGGIVLQLMSLMTDIGRHPTKLTKFGMENPMIEFLSKKLGPVPSLAEEIRTGKDSLGRPSGGLLQAATKVGIPISAQSMASRAAGAVFGGSPGSKANFPTEAVRFGAGLAGLRSRIPSKISDMHKLAEDFLKAKNLKKETGWELVRNEEPSYSRLRAAAMGGSDTEFKQAYEGLRKTHSPTEIREGMADWLKRGFTGTVAHEGRFFSSLSADEKNDYREAKREKLKTWRAYNQMKSRMK
jgi:hypothetical protein